MLIKPRVAVILTATLWLPGCATVKLTQEIQVSEVVKEIQETLQELSEKPQANVPRFESAEISLETVTKQESGGEFKLLVISIGSSISNSMVQTVYYKLVPPTPKLGVAENKDISRELGKAIIKAAQEINAALKPGANLELKQLSATVKFEVEKTSSGGVEVEVAPVTLGGTATKSRGASHSVTLNFEVPDKAK
jgi:hypothetical protein